MFKRSRDANEVKNGQREVTLINSKDEMAQPTSQTFGVCLKIASLSSFPALGPKIQSDSV